MPTLCITEKLESQLCEESVLSECAQKNVVENISDSFQLGMKSRQE